MNEAAERIEAERRRLNDLADPNPHNMGQFPTKPIMGIGQFPRNADDISWALAHARDIADMNGVEYDSYVRQQQKQKR